jgi:chromosome segregation ATPase
LHTYLQAKEEAAVLRLNLASTETTIEIVKEERSQLAKNLQDADEGILSIENQLRLKNEEFGAKIDNVSTKALFLETQMETLQSQLKNTIDERDSLKNQLAETQNTLTNLREKHETTLVTLAEEMSLVQQHENHIVTLSAEKRDALAEANEMGAEVIETREGMLLIQEELKQALNNEKQLQQNLLDAKRDAYHVRDRINALEERLEKNFTENGDSKKILATFTAKVVEFEAQKNQLVIEMREKSKALERINALYDTEVKAKEKLLRKLTGTKSLQKSLQDKLTAAESELQTLNEQLVLSQDKESKVSIVAAELKKQVSKLEEKVLTVSKEKDKSIQELSKINDVLRREIGDVQSSLESIQFFKESIKTEVDKTVDQNELLSKENENMKTELKKASDDLLVVQEELRGAKEHLQEHLTEANKNIHMLKQQLTEAQSEVLSLKQESIEANENIFELCNKLLDLEALLNDTRARNTETLRRIAISMDISGEINADVVEKQLASLNKYVEELEDEFAESVLLKMKVEDELEEEKLKATSLSDQVFDICQEKQDIQMCLEAVSRKLLAIEEDKQALEDEFAKAEKVIILLLQKISLAC